MAVCDEDAEYGRQLAKYYLEHGRLDCVDSFSNWEELKAHVEKNAYDVCLIHHTILELQQRKATGEEADELFKKVLASMVEQGNTGSCCYICLAEVEIKEDIAKLPRVYKYQSAETLLQQLYRLMADLRPRETVNGRYSDYARRTIGLLSPWYSGTSLVLGMAFGQALHEYGRVLYVNAKGFHGMPDGIETADLSDILLALRMDIVNKSAALQSAVAAGKKLDYITPVRNPMQIADITAEDMTRLIEAIWTSLDYDYLVIELPHMLEHMEEVMSLCGRMISFEQEVCGVDVLHRKVEELVMGQESVLNLVRLPGHVMDFIEHRAWQELEGTVDGVEEYMREQVIEGGDFVDGE